MMRNILQQTAEFINNIFPQAELCYSGADRMPARKRFEPLMLAAKSDGASAEKKENDAPETESAVSDNLLKNRIHDLMALAEDEDEAEDAELLETLNKPKKKKFFGLF